MRVAIHIEKEKEQGFYLGAGNVSLINDVFEKDLRIVGSDSLVES